MLAAGSRSDCGFPETSHQSQPEFCIKQQLAMHDTSAIAPTAQGVVKKVAKKEELEEKAQSSLQLQR